MKARNEKQEKLESKNRSQGHGSHNREVGKGKQERKLRKGNWGRKSKKGRREKRTQEIGCKKSEVRKWK